MIRFLLAAVAPCGESFSRTRLPADKVSRNGLPWANLTLEVRYAGGPGEDTRMAETFQRHRQAWTTDEVQKLHLLAGKGMSLKAISKAMTRTEESIQTRAKIDKLKISKLR